MPQPLLVSFTAGVYSMDAIKKALYRLSGSLTADINSNGDSIECVLYPRPEAQGSPEELVHAFRTEILDQDLRISIATETAPMRNAILAYAFSKTGLQEIE